MSTLYFKSKTHLYGLVSSLHCTSGRCGDNNVLHRVAVAALHRYYLLLKQSAAFIHLNFIATRLAS